ncbi:hypothetical protein DVH05_016793 [Phytophthora capsici]|nr:hypothetical protein DVH05_016793 [Phytophthora capsici]
MSVFFYVGQIQNLVIVLTFSFLGFDNCKRKIFSRFFISLQTTLEGFCRDQISHGLGMPASTSSLWRIFETTREAGVDETGGIISVDQTVNVNESTASILAEQITSKLSEYVQSGACVDEHLADNAVVFMALAQEIATQLTGATYRLNEEESSAIIEVDGIGHRR